MKKIITINSVFGGHQVSDYFGLEGQFRNSIGIDPDMPAKDNGAKPCGLLRPTSMADFTGAVMDNTPLWILTTPKGTKIYIYLINGKLISYTSAFGSETLAATASSSSGNGMAYYDNYIYLAKNTDIARYGRMDGSPSITQSYWVGSLSKAALVDKTYPSINGVEMPNHPMHRHTDDKLYIADVLSSNKGCLHFIKTKKTTNEGDTNDGSSADALDFDYGEYPTAIETYGGDLAVALIEGTNTTIKQKPAKLSFWDTSSTSFSKITSVEFPDPLITALKNVNGILYVFSGYATGGCRVSVFAGGYNFQEIAWFPDVFPPLSSGAVDHILNRIIFGTNTKTPEASASVFALGNKEKNLYGGIHNILRTTSAGANPIITCAKYVQQSSGKIVQPIAGWIDDSNKGIDKISETYGNYNIWQSELYRVGRKFQIKKLTIPLVQAVAANMALKVKVVSNDGDDTKTIQTINNTNYPNSEKLIELYPDGEFKNNFFLQFEWENTALLTVSLPISIELEIYES